MSQPRTLLEIAEPIFLHVCRMNRLGRSGSSAKEGQGDMREQFEAARDKTVELIEKFDSDSESDTKLARRAENVRKALVFFVDYSLSYSSLPYAELWGENRLAVRGLCGFTDLAGDTNFFRYLDAEIENLKSTDGVVAEDARECLAIYYVCLGLGFLGQYQALPPRERSEHLKGLMDTIWRHVKQRFEVSPTKLLCKEEAYDTVVTKDFTQPASKAIMPWAVAVTVFCIGVFIGYCGLYWAASKNLSAALQVVASKAPAEEQK